MTDSEPQPTHEGKGPEPEAGIVVPVTASGLPNPHGLPEIAVDRPEVALGAAFGGGLLLALILKRLGR